MQLRRIALAVCCGLITPSLHEAAAQCGNVHSPYGINAHAPGGPNLAVVFDKVQAAGIGWVRIDFNWFFVETSQDVFNWSLYDAIAAAAEARGIRIFATLAYTPQWATSGSLQTGVPNDPADWYDFCYRAAQRYPSIQHWGMWNEPNLDHFWAGTRQQYIDMILRNGADAIHAANPAAKVCAPELAHLVSGSADWYRWLYDSILQAGDKIDIITHHTYDSDGPNDVTQKLARTTIFGNDPSRWSDTFAPSVREVLASTGRLGSPFWLTEVGWASNEVGEANQASYYTGFLTEWFTGKPDRDWIHKVFFYELQDDPTPSVPKWGILHANADEKPAYASYRTFALAHPPPPVPPCKARDPLPAHQATGVALDADLSWTAGAFATSHRVHFGTTDPPGLVSVQTDSSYDPGPLTPETTYYWRIDEVNAEGVTTGDVWRFTTVPPPLPGKATNPSPAHLATGVSRTPQFTWTAGLAATSHRIYLGTSSPGTLKATQTETTYTPGTLAGQMTYYWRVDEVNTTGTTTGDVWSFTTGGWRADFDNDGDVDQSDYGFFQACISGPHHYAPGCEAADFNGEGDVDNEDLSAFLSCMAGADQPPACAAPASSP